VVKALRDLADETLIDGEVVAFDDSGPPSFNVLQNSGFSSAPIFYYAFDLLIFAGTNIRSEPLEARRELLRTDILPKLSEPIRYSPELESSLDDLIRSVREQKFEGLIAKRRDSRYESGGPGLTGSPCTQTQKRAHGELF
jgi:bifunctional non-homologous end joining protein LigD